LSLCISLDEFVHVRRLHGFNFKDESKKVGKVLGIWARKVSVGMTQGMA
jgi:hypothetical protein